MTDGKVQECRNGCGRKIFVSDRSGRWIPYDIGTDNKHDCPNFQSNAQSKQTTDFNRNKQMYGGPTEQNQVQTDVANLVGDVAVMKEQIKELQYTLNGLGKTIAEQSFKPASEIDSGLASELADDEAEA